MKPIRILLLAGVAWATLGASALGQTFQTDRTVDAPRGARLHLENQAGDVTIRTWSRNAVRVQARHASNVRVEIDTRGSLVEVEAHPPGHPGREVAYTLTIPEGGKEIGQFQRGPAP